MIQRIFLRLRTLQSCNVAHLDVLSKEWSKESLEKNTSNQSRRSLEGPQAQIQIYIIILLILDIRRDFRWRRKNCLRVIIAMYLHQRGDEGGEILLAKIRF